MNIYARRPAERHDAIFLSIQNTIFFCSPLRIPLLRYNHPMFGTILEEKTRQEVPKSSMRLHDERDRARPGLDP